MSIVLAKISKVNYEAGTADITIPDRNRQVVKSIPFLSDIYEMPSVGDSVYADIEVGGGRLGRGVILGKYYTKKNRPKESGKGIFLKEFTDGASIKYDPATKTMTINADKVVVRELYADSIHTEG